MDNNVNEKIDPNFQKMSNIQARRMIIHERVEKKIHGDFVGFQKKINRFYFDQGNSNRKWMEMEMEVRIKKRKVKEEQNKETMINKR